MGKISEIFNFDNIGGKIKNVAKWSCWITILLIWVSAPIAFIVLVLDDWTAYLCWIPLVGAIVGPVFVWISSWAMYAFGELVENVEIISNKKAPVIKVKTEPTQHSVINTNQSVTKTGPFVKENEKISNNIKISSRKEHQEHKEGSQKILPCPLCGEDLAFMDWDDDDLKEKQTCPFCGQEIIL